MTLRGLISHIDLNVSDPGWSIPFYGLVLEHLGFARYWVEPVDGRASLADAQASDRCAWWITYAGGATLGIEVRPPAQPAPRSRHERYSPGIDHLALHGGSTDDVDSLHAALVAGGVEVAEPPREYDYSPGYYAVAFDDPDGMRIEVVYEPGSNP